MCRQGLMSLAALALTGLAAVVAQPMELFGYDTAPDTYDFLSGIMSSDCKYIWIVAESDPEISKFMTNPSDFSPTYLSSLELPMPEEVSGAAWAIVQDATGEYGLVYANGEWPEPGRILKIALGAGAAAPTYVNEVELDNGERGCKSSVAHDGYAYFGTGWGSDTQKIIKVAFGNGAAAPTRVGATTPSAGEEVFSNGAVINGPAGKAFFGYGGGMNGGLVKISLGGSGAPSRDSALPFPETNLVQGAIDIDNDLAYWVGNDETLGGTLFRIDLNSDSAAAPAIVDSMAVCPDDYPGSIVLDLEGDGIAYVMCGPVVHKVELNGPTGTMEVVETLDVVEASGADDTGDEFTISLYDSATGLLYVTPYNRGMVFKIGTKGVPPMPPPSPSPVPTPDGNALATLRGRGTPSSARGKRATVTLRLTAAPANTTTGGKAPKVGKQHRRALYNAVEKTPKPFNTTQRYKKNAVSFYEVVLDLPDGVRAVKVGAPGPVRSSGKPVIADNQVVWPRVPLFEGRRKPHAVTLKVTVAILPTAENPLSFEALALKLPNGPVAYMYPSVDVQLKA